MLNLATAHFLKVKQTAKEECGRSSKYLADKIGVDEEHVSRHFRHADYNISPALMPALCEAMGNDLQIEWQCFQIGGFLGKVIATKREDMHLDTQMGKVFNEASDVMGAWAAMIMDGKKTHEELDQMEREMIQLQRKTAETLYLLHKMREDGHLKK